MQAEIRENTTNQGAWCVTHPLSPEDSAAMTALRSAVAGMKGKLEGTAARGPFNGIMKRVAAPGGVTFEADTVGGISGWWARPTQARKGAAILHLHGGWFNWGTAQDFRNLIRPGRAQKHALACDRGTALAALSAVEFVARDLETRR